MSTPDERLLAAVESGDLEAARRAFDEGANANHSEIRSYRCVPVLYTACTRKDRAMVRLLLDRGALANDGDTEQAPWGSDSTPNIYVACPDIEIMRALLEKGADPNASGHSRDDVMTVYPLREHSCMTAEIRALLREFGGRSARVARFVKSEYRRFRGKPTATLSGTAARRGPSGEAIPASQQPVTLIPATTYSDEWWQREILRGDRLLAPDSRTAGYECHATTDEAGRFRFAGLTAGDYYLYCCFPEPPGAAPGSREVVLGTPVTVRERETLEVALAEIAREAGGHQGTGVVKGEAAIRTPTGGLTIAAHQSVCLVPVTEPATAMWERLGRREIQPPPDPEAFPFDRRSTVDEAGRFRIEQVAAGEYFVYCRVEMQWEQMLQFSPGVQMPGVLHQKIMLGARITVREGETVQADLERVD